MNESLKLGHDLNSSAAVAVMSPIRAAGLPVIYKSFCLHELKIDWLQALACGRHQRRSGQRINTVNRGRRIICLVFYYVKDINFLG